MAKSDYITHSNGKVRLYIYQSDIQNASAADPYVNVSVYLQFYTGTSSSIMYTVPSWSATMLNSTYTNSGSDLTGYDTFSSWKTVATLFSSKGIWSVSKTRTSFNVSFSGNVHLGLLVSGTISLSGTITMQSWPATPSSGTKDTASIPSSMTMGSAASISITHKTTGNKNTLTWKFGSQSGTLLSSSTATSTSWTPPTSLGSQIPSATSGTVTFTLTTYNSGGTNLGSTTYTSTLSVPSYSLSTPTVSAAKNSYTGVGSYVANKTQTRFTLSGLPSGTYGATVTGSYAITLAGASQSSGTKTGTSSSTVDYTAAAAGALQLTYTIRDSRGKTASASASTTYVANQAPTISFSAARASSPTTNWSGTASGTYLNVTGNSATVTFSTGSAGTNSASSGSFSRTVSGTLADSSSLSITATVTDTLGNTASRTATISTVFAYLEATPNKVISIGRKADTSASSKIQIGLPMECDDQIKLLSGSTVQTKLCVLTSSAWNKGRDNATLASSKQPSSSGDYYPLLSLKSYNNDWAIGTLNSDLYFVDTMDTNYSANRNYFCGYKLAHVDTTSGYVFRDILTTVNTADRVIEQGTTSSWNYRKWASGWYECWRRYEHSVAVNSAWGQVYYGTVPRVNYPVTFASSPYEQAACVGGNAAAWIGGAAYSPTTTQTANYYLMRPASQSSTSYNIDYYVRGQLP